MSRTQLLLLICTMTLIVFFTGIWIGDRELYAGALSTGTLLSALVLLFTTDVRARDSKRGGR